nr:hypothetical protein [Gemmatimonadaceae bacterium]
MIRLLKVAAVLVAVLMGAALIVPSLVLRTDGGRGWARGVAERQLNTILGGRGRIGIGSITALSTSSATLRDITLHDRWGGRIARIGETQLRFHPGALTRKVVHFRAIDVRDVELDVIQRLDSVFNVVSLLPDTSAPRRGPPGWGDDVRADSVRISNGRMQVQVLWAPHRTFVGQERDSITALYRTFHDVRDTAGRLVVTRRFTSMNGTLTDAHFTRPEGGGVVRLASLATVMSDPALPVRDAQGTLEWSPARQLRIDLPRVVLRETRGAVRGTVGWKDPGPVRYDLDVPADSVALADINWVWPALPVTGGGRTRLTIRSADDADIVDYALDSLAMVAEGSDVRGQVTVRVTPRTIELSRMHLAFAPLSARVIRRVMEGELPEPLRGDVRGSVHANAGGPLAAVRIDSARLTYREQGGATARLAFDGVVGSGASTILRNVRVREFVLPLGIARPLVAEWPAGLDGTLTARGVVSGDLTRGSVDASGLTIGLTGANGRAVSLTGRVSGTGLLTDAGRFDLSIASTALDPRALGALGDSLPIAGPIAVQLAARGTVQRFTVDAALRPPSDTAGIRVVGTVARTTARAAFDGSVALNGLDVRALTQRDALPRTRLSGSVTVAASATRDARRATPWQLVDGAVRGRIAQPDGEGLLEATLTADVSLDATALSVRHAELVSPSARASLLGVLRRDSVGAPPDWRPLIVTAEGDSVVGDSLHAAVRVDSLHAFVGDLRRLARALPEGDSLRAQIDALPDSIGGEVYATAHVTGSVATPRALLDVDARRMAIGPITVGDASVRADGRWPLDGTLRATAHDIAGAALGLTTVTLTADSVRTDGARL